MYYYIYHYSGFGSGPIYSAMGSGLDSGFNAAGSDRVSGWLQIQLSSSSRIVEWIDATFLAVSSANRYQYFQQETKNKIIFRKSGHILLLCHALELCSFPLHISLLNLAFLLLVFLVNFWKREEAILSSFLLVSQPLPRLHISFMIFILILRESPWNT